MKARLNHILSEYLLNGLIDCSKFKSKNELNNHSCSEHRDTMQSKKSDTNSEQQRANLKSRKKTTWSTADEVYNCSKCPFSCKSTAQLNNHMQWKHTNINQKEEEFNCDGCDYQGTTRLQLNKHRNLKHIAKDQPKIFKKHMLFTCFFIILKIQFAILCSK